MARAKLNAKLAAAVAAQSEPDVVAALTKRADPAAVASDGFPAIVLAGWKGHTAVLALLLESSGSGIECKSRSGLTALVLAGQEGHTETVELLLERKADVNAQGVGGITALTQALKNQHVPLAALLVSKGNADVRSRTLRLLSAGLLPGARPRILHPSDVKHLCCIRYQISAPDRTMYASR